MAGWGDPIVGGIALRIPAIRSPNYVAGSTGWTINIDGSVEFNNGTFRGTVTAGTFQGTDFVINSAGAFFYSGTPGVGNLVVSITQSSGTDTFGNPYLTGVSSYGNVVGTFSEMAGGNVLVGNINSGVPDTTDAGVMQALGPLMIIRPPVNASPSLIRDAARLTLQSGRTGQTTGNANAPFITVLADDLASDADVQLSGSVVKTNQGSTPYTWQTGAAAATNWALGDGAGTSLAFQYRLDALDNVVALGSIHMTLAAGLLAGTYQFLAAVIPAVYRPASSQLIAAVHTSSTSVVKSACTFQLLSTGAFRVSTPSAIAQNDIFYLNGTFPLGHIP